MIVFRYLLVVDLLQYFPQQGSKMHTKRYVSFTALNDNTEFDAFHEVGGVI